MINPIKCLICGFLAGSLVGLGVLFAGKQSQYLPLLLTTTGIAGVAGATSTLTLLMETKASKRMLVRGLRDLKGNYEDMDKLVKIELIEEEIWRL
jgi:hypothetical protein